MILPYKISSNSFNFLLVSISGLTLITSSSNLASALFLGFPASFSCALPTSFDPATTSAFLIVSTSSTLFAVKYLEIVFLLSSSDFNIKSLSAFIISGLTPLPAASVWTFLSNKYFNAFSFCSLAAAFLKKGNMDWSKCL